MLNKRRYLQVDQEHLTSEQQEKGKINKKAWLSATSKLTLAKKKCYATSVEVHDKAKAASNNISMRYYPQDDHLHESYMLAQVHRTNNPHQNFKYLMRSYISDIALKPSFSRVLAMEMSPVFTIFPFSWWTKQQRRNLWNNMYSQRKNGHILAIIKITSSYTASQV